MRAPLGVPAPSAWLQLARLTCAFVPGMQQLHQRSRGPLGINRVSSFLVLGQLAQHSSCHPLDVLHWGVEQLSGEEKQREPLLAPQAKPSQGCSRPASPAAFTHPPRQLLHVPIGCSGAQSHLDRHKPPGASRNHPTSPSPCAATQSPTCTKRGIVLSRKISMRFIGSRARICRAPVHPSTISSIFTPSCKGSSDQHQGTTGVNAQHRTTGVVHGRREDRAQFLALPPAWLQWFITADRVVTSSRDHPAGGTLNTKRHPLRDQCLYGMEGRAWPWHACCTAGSAWPCLPAS